MTYRTITGYPFDSDQAYRGDPAQTDMLGRGRHTFYVTWPEGTQPPEGKPRAYRERHTSREESTRAAQAFKDQGAQISA